MYDGIVLRPKKIVQAMKCKLKTFCTPFQRKFLYLHNVVFKYPPLPFPGKGRTYCFVYLRETGLGIIFRMFVIFYADANSSFCVAVLYQSIFLLPYITIASTRNKPI